MAGSEAWLDIQVDLSGASQPSWAGCLTEEKVRNAYENLKNSSKTFKSMIDMISGGSISVVIYELDTLPRCIRYAERTRQC